MKSLKESILSKQVDIDMDVRDAFPDWIHPAVLDEMLRPMESFIEQKRNSERSKQIQADLLKVAEWFHSMKDTTFQKIFTHPNTVRNAGFYYYESDYMKGRRGLHLSFTTQPAQANQLEREVQKSKWNGPYLRIEVNVDRVEIHFVISK